MDFVLMGSYTFFLEFSRILFFLKFSRVLLSFGSLLGCYCLLAVLVGSYFLLGV